MPYSILLYIFFLEFKNSKKKSRKLTNFVYKLNLTKCTDKEKDFRTILFLEFFYTKPMCINAVRRVCSKSPSLSLLFRFIPIFIYIVHQRLFGKQLNGVKD